MNREEIGEDDETLTCVGPATAPGAEIVRAAVTGLKFIDWALVVSG